MEARKIIVKTTSDQKTHNIMSSATTLGELKADLDARGIIYNNMTFNEGYSRTILTSDSSLLPTNVTNRRTGETTNELVFMLTNNEKNIKSGADRKALVAYLKENNLTDKLKEALGKNWTICTTSEIEQFVNSYAGGVCDAAPEEKAYNTCTETQTPDAMPEGKPLYGSDFDLDTAKKIHSLEVRVAALEEALEVKKQEEIKENAEIDSLFDFLP